MGITAPNAPAGVLWLMTAAMVLGRLEFFPIFVALLRLVGDLPAPRVRPTRSSNV